jgi:hypothetical protein
MVVLGLATGAPPGDGGALRDDSIFLSLSGYFLTDTYAHRVYYCP